MIMIEAVRDELKPFLVAEGVPVPRGMGIGVDCGNVTVTKIGLADAIEVTAYGSAVNQAAKRSKLLNQLWISSKANRLLHGVDKANALTQSKRRLLGEPK
ncbi:hypothetical protein WME98_32275 [Sorangium sp. So ce296]|uniref:hypothetical protein n=1 Tax=Sorangium sp. So ce296 TaxID=3133296 RepID=UPI003F5E78F2